MQLAPLPRRRTSTTAPYRNAARARLSPRRRTPTSRAAHLEACARWNEANRQFRRAADRLYRQERRRRERQDAGLPPHKTHLTPQQRAAERKRLVAERVWWRKEHAVIERERDEKQRRIKAERGRERLLHH